MEAIILAGGKAERLGDAAQGRPKALVPIAGRPLAAYQVDLLVKAGVERILVSCALGFEHDFIRELSGLGAEIVAVSEHRPLGRGGGLRLAAKYLSSRRHDIFALNGDELLDIDLRAMLEVHQKVDAAATIAIVPLRSQFGIVQLAGNDRVVGFWEAPVLPHWNSCGVYVLGQEAIQMLPEEGDHERTTFPDLAHAGLIHAYRHMGLWITVNTPKDLRQAEEAFANGRLA